MGAEPSISIENQLIREIDLLNREVAQLRRDAKAVAEPAERRGWSHINTPAALAVIGIIGTIGGGIWRLHSGRELEREKQLTLQGRPDFRVQRTPPRPGSVTRSISLRRGR